MVKTRKESLITKGQTLVGRLRLHATCIVLKNAYVTDVSRSFFKNRVLVIFMQPRGGATWSPGSLGVEPFLRPQLQLLPSGSGKENDFLCKHCSINMPDKKISKEVAVWGGGVGWRYVFYSNEETRFKGHQYAAVYPPHRQDQWGLGWCWLTQVPRTISILNPQGHFSSWKEMVPFQHWS